jgi:DNA (cytosine-5)-methyltransferase 1
MTFGSVCSGIESASVAWEPLGMRPVYFSEIEKFPSAVLEHHWPHVPNLGDMTVLPDAVRAGIIPPTDILVGGTPCQAFSVAGLRQGLADDRGQLTIKFVELADAIDEQRDEGDECVVVWENVPGVLSSKDNAFGCFLGALAGEDEAIEPSGKKWTNAGCVYGPKRAIAWRILDAQYFGVAQRRRRVFVVASSRKGFDPATVLFESEGVRRDTPPSRETGETTAHPVAPSLTASGRGVERVEETRGQDYETESFVIHAADVSPAVSTGAPFSKTGNERVEADALVAFHVNAQPYQMNFSNETTAALTCSQNAGALIARSVRRLTPTECERLQGFPDGHTAIPWRGKPADECPDGPRYKALGNSKAVPVVRWLGARIIAHYYGAL